jgi:serine/threonine-protein kinase
MADPPAALQTELRDRYVGERELGRGGMTTVYLAPDLKHDREVEAMARGARRLHLLREHRL